MSWQTKNISNNNIYHIIIISAVCPAKERQESIIIFGKIRLLARTAGRLAAMVNGVK